MDNAELNADRYIKETAKVSNNILTRAGAATETYHGVYVECDQIIQKPARRSSKAINLIRRRSSIKEIVVL